MKLSELARFIPLSQKVGIWTLDRNIFNGYLRSYTGEDYNVAFIRGCTDASIDIWVG